MFSLGSPLAAPSLTEPARVRSQEREKETKSPGGLGRGGAGTRAGRPRPRWLRREGRRGRAGKTRNAVNPAEATLRRTGSGGSSLLRGERPYGRAAAAGQWLAGSGLLSRPARTPVMHRRARARTLTGRAPPRRGYPPPSAGLRPAPRARPVDWAPVGGAGVGQGRSYVTGACALCAPATAGADRYLRGLVVSLETKPGLGGAETRPRLLCPGRSQDAG